METFFDGPAVTESSMKAVDVNPHLSFHTIPLQPPGIVPGPLFAVHLRDPAPPWVTVTLDFGWMKVVICCDVVQVTFQVTFG